MKDHQVIQTLWAIANSATGDLVCWKGSKGVPFMSPNKELTESTLLEQDACIDAPAPGTHHELVEVIVVHDDTQNRVIILNAETHTLLSVLGPSEYVR